MATISLTYEEIAPLILAKTNGEIKRLDPMTNGLRATISKRGIDIPIKIEYWDHTEAEILFKYSLDSGSTSIQFLGKVFQSVISTFGNIFTKDYVAVNAQHLIIRKPGSIEYCIKDVHSENGIIEITLEIYEISRVD